MPEMTEAEIDALATRVVSNIEEKMRVVLSRTSQDNNPVVLPKAVDVTIESSHIKNPG